MWRNAKLWQLPTYDGTKSYQNLLVGVYEMENAGDGRDITIQKSPLSFIRSGFYYYSYGRIDNRNSSGNYWMFQFTSDTNARGLFFYSASLNLQYANAKGIGFSIRCLGR